MDQDYLDKMYFNEKDILNILSHLKSIDEKIIFLDKLRYKLVDIIRTDHPDELSDNKTKFKKPQPPFKSLH